jgi:hypothetical protein
MSLPPDSGATARMARTELWVTMLTGAGPLLWFAALVIMYAVCAHGRSWDPALSWPVLAVSIAASTAALVKLVSMARALPATPSPLDTRAKFMRWGGVALNVLSLVLLVGLGIPLLMQGR